MIRLSVVALLLAGLAVPVRADAHGDKLDTYGCHKNRSAGGYHCHKGPFTGRSFQSQDEMLKAQRARRGGASTPPQKKK